MIEFFFESVDDLPLSEEDVQSWLTRVVTGFGKELGCINYIFCSDDYLLEVNKEHLNHDYYTDIITFDYCENNVVSGDLFVSVDRVKDNASNFNVSFLDELYRVMAHGVLHLCGLEDKTDAGAKAMRIAEDEALLKL